MSGLKVQTLRDAVLGTNKGGPVVFQIKLLASPASVATVTSAEQAITVTGLAVGDVVLSANKPTDQAGLTLANGRIGANTWYAKFANQATTSIVPTAGEVYDLIVLRPAS